MTDPRCPYCGQAMELIPGDPQLHADDPEQCYWYECPDCASVSPVRDTPERANWSAHQRCTPPAQPLTRAELLALERPWPLWVERPGFPLAPMMLYTSCYGDNDEKILVISDFYLDVNSYGHTWRCWLNKPTDAEREAAAWDGGAAP